MEWFQYEASRLGLATPVVLDPTAGGGSIPFESERLGLSTFANDLNPVATLILEATIDIPLRYETEALREVERLSKRFVELALPRFTGIVPREPEGIHILGYLWARTCTCPYCDGLIPLSPNWKLASDGTGVLLLSRVAGGPSGAGRLCDFEIVTQAREQSPATVARDSATRAAKGALGPADGSHTMLDAIHHAAYSSRSRTLEAAREMLVKSGVATEPRFLAALEAVLEVLPPSRTFTGFDPDAAVAPAAQDFDVLEHLRRLAFPEQIDAPEQLRLWEEAR